MLPLRAFGQARADTAQASADSVAAPPRPIPTAEIISRADSLDAFLRGQSAEVTAPDDRIAEVDSLLPRAATTVATLLQDSDSVRGG